MHASGEFNRSHDGVVGPRLDRSIVDEEQVGERREADERVVVAEGDRFVGDVSARHHERRAGVGEQQVVKRRVRQDHAELSGCWSHRIRDRRIRQARRKDDRPLGANQQLALPPAQCHQ